MLWKTTSNWMKRRKILSSSLSTLKVKWTRLRKMQFLFKVRSRIFSKKLWLRCMSTSKKNQIFWSQIVMNSSDNTKKSCLCKGSLESRLKKHLHLNFYSWIQATLRLKIKSRSSGPKSPQIWQTTKTTWRWMANQLSSWLRLVVRSRTRKTSSNPSN